MTPSSTRRHFLKTTTTAALALATLPASVRAQQPANRLRVGVMGVNGRGMAHVSGFLAVPGVEIAYVCDVDSRALAKAADAVARQQGGTPKTVSDFRRILDDPTVDALSIAAPNHWHAPAAILACAAGKHVYVEKPGSHNGREAELLMAAARRHRRVVQMGNQRRSYPGMIEAIERLHAGEIGAVRFARTWYANTRGSIGRGKQTPVPTWLDYTLWQGPAPDRPYVDNLVHYNWHWRWHWGGGELANNGIHALDLARWGLRVTYPRSVTTTGGRYHFQDDQETPDTYVTSYDFGHCGASWESHSCHPRGFEGEGFGVHFYGDNGSLIIGGSDAKFLDLRQKITAEIKGRARDRDHFQNFADAIRDGKNLRSDIAEGQIATIWCHLGNIAWRTGSALKVDPQTGRVLDNPAARKLWTRDYRRGWEPKVG